MKKDKSLQKLWNYLAVSDKADKSDLIPVLGRDDFNIPKKALELFKNNFAPMILVSGKRGRLTGAIEGTEAAAFCDYLKKQEIPQENILLEENSTNTGENFWEGLKILRAHNITPKQVLLVTHGPHMRRALAAARFSDNKIKWLAIPDNCDFSSHGLDEIAKELVGEVDRLENYPKLGFFTAQDIPEEILIAKREAEKLF